MIIIREEEEMTIMAIILTMTITTMMEGTVEVGATIMEEEDLKRIIEEEKIWIPMDRLVETRMDLVEIPMDLKETRMDLVEIPMDLVEIPMDLIETPMNRLLEALIVGVTIREVTVEEATVVVVVVVAMGDMIKVMTGNQIHIPVIQMTIDIQMVKRAPLSGTFGNGVCLVGVMKPPPHMEAIPLMEAMKIMQVPKRRQKVGVYSVTMTMMTPHPMEVTPPMEALIREVIIIIPAEGEMIRSC